MRTFRLDRIREAKATGELFDPSARTGAETSFAARGLPVARLSFARDTFTERDWPGATVVEADADRTIVDVPYAGTAWISRQVCSRLGSATVLEPPEVREAVAAAANAIAGQLAE
jgi:predicted DNA-binding transcriptional regulator YafY